jgi:hypothetical protein
VIKRLSRLSRAALKNLFRVMVSIILIGAPLVLIRIYDPMLLDSITQDMSIHSAVFVFLRWGLIVLTIVAWPFIARTIGQYKGASSITIDYWKAENFRIVAWLIIFELLICENVIGKLIHLL